MEKSKIIKNVTDENMSSAFDIPMSQICNAKSYKQLSPTGQELLVAKRDEETGLWEVTFNA